MALLNSHTTTARRHSAVQSTAAPILVFCRSRFQHPTIFRKSSSSSLCVWVLCAYAYTISMHFVKAARQSKALCACLLFSAIRQTTKNDSLFDSRHSSGGAHRNEPKLYYYYCYYIRCAVFGWRRHRCATHCAQTHQQPIRNRVREREEKREKTPSKHILFAYRFAVFTYCQWKRRTDDAMKTTLSKKGHRIHKRKRRQRFELANSVKRKWKTKNNKKWERERENAQGKKTKESKREYTENLKREYDGISYVNSHMNLNIALFRGSWAKESENDNTESWKCTTDDGARGVESAKDIVNLLCVCVILFIWWVFGTCSHHLLIFTHFAANSFSFFGSAEIYILLRVFACASFDLLSTERYFHEIWWLCEMYWTLIHWFFISFFLMKLPSV